MVLRKLMLLVSLLAAVPAAAAPILYNFMAMGGGATVGATDYTGGHLLFTVGADTDAYQPAAGQAWQWQVPGTLFQLYAADRDMANFTYAVTDLPVLVYAGDGPTPFVGLALADGTRLLEFADDRLAGIDLRLATDLAGLTPTFFNSGLTFESFDGAVTLTDAPASHGFAAGADLPVPVPEPTSWALLIVGFGLTGAALRRRRAMA